MGQTTTKTTPMYKTPPNDQPKQNEKQNEKLSIYVLELQDGKYYVGKTKNPVERINEHIQNTGSTWTSKYKPIRIMNIHPMKDSFDEDKFTLNLMKEKGIMK